MKRNPHSANDSLEFFVIRGFHDLYLIHSDLSSDLIYGGKARDYEFVDDNHLIVQNTNTDFSLVDIRSNKAI